MWNPLCGGALFVWESTFWDSLFSGAMLNFGGVSASSSCCFFLFLASPVAVFV